MKLPVSSDLFEHLITSWAEDENALTGDSQDLNHQAAEAELQELIEKIKEATGG